MKKFLVVVVLLLSFSFASNAQVTNYNRVDVYNSAGANAVDFQFSYDTYDQCMNNFIVYNNLGYRLRFQFKIYLNDNLVYKGWVDVKAGGYVAFNDAFYRCKSSYGVIKIVTS